MSEEKSIPKSTLSRLPAYLRYLKDEAEKGVAYISSASLAGDMGLSAVCVRKDLSLVASAPGKPRFGFEITKLITDIEHRLGYHRRINAIVMGAGGLGRAILAYDGFAYYGIDIVAAFDVLPEKVGSFSGKTVYPVDRVKEIAERFQVTAAVLTVPRSAAQEACDTLVQAGIRSILSFAPVYLTVPKGIRMKYVDLAVSLASLSGALSKTE